jgi:hypothetical protein
MTKRWHTWQGNMPKSGCQDTLGQNPKRCVHNNGGEFVGPEFQFLLQGCRIKDAPTSSKNSQPNAICEQMYQTVGNALQTLLHG